MFEDYREALQTAFFERKTRNSAYSLRAFARDIGMASSNLSLVLARRKGIKRSTAEKIAERLDLTKSERELFCNLVEREHGKSEVARQEAKRALIKSKSLSTNLSVDLMKVVGGWFHFAVLEALRTPAIEEHTVPALATALAVDEMQVTAALETLTKAGLIKKLARRYKVTHDFHWSPDGIPSEVIRKAHERHLVKSLQALFSQSVNERDFTSMILAIDASDLKSAKNDIREFIKRFTDKYSEKKTANRVYALNLQLFNLTPGMNEKTS